MSVVIATYNYGRFLPLALQSLLDQTFDQWEAVIIDDGSTDNTDQIIQPYLRDSRLQYHRSAHLGQPAAKNLGIQRTSAPLVAFLDADDIWLACKLERQVPLFDQDPRIGVVCSRWLNIDGQGELFEKEERELYRGEVLSRMFWRNFVCFSSSVVKRSVLEQVGTFDESLELAIDFDLWLRAATCCQFDYVDEPLVMYRQGHRNLSSRGLERTESARLIRDRFLRQNGGPERLDPELYRRAIAEHWSDVGYLHHDRPLTAIRCFAKSLYYGPKQASVWRALLSCWWPARIQNLARTVLRRPDWRVIHTAVRSEPIVSAASDNSDPLGNG